MVGSDGKSKSSEGDTGVRAEEVAWRVHLTSDGENDFTVEVWATGPKEAADKAWTEANRPVRRGYAWEPWHVEALPVTEEDV